jgi:threonine synthase
VGDFLILDAIRESNGFATAVSDEAILTMQARVAQSDGILLCPEGAATAAALAQEIESGRISKNEKVVLFNCATGLKYPMPASDQFVDRHSPIDYNQF